MFGGDGFDDEAAARGGVEGNGGVGDGGRDHALDGGFVEGGGGGELEEANLLAGAGQQFVGIGELGALEKTQADTARVGGDGEDGFRWALGRAEAEDKEVVVVVNHLDGVRQPLPHFGPQRPGERGDLRREFGDEAGDLGLE